jgi:hypothetical protein
MRPDHSVIWHRPGPATCSGIADRRLEWPLSWQSVTVAGWRRVEHLAGWGLPVPAEGLDACWGCWPGWLVADLRGGP